MWRCAVLMIGLAAPAAAAGAERVALVIGNSAYPTLPALAACAGSASVVSAALKRAGFAVTELNNGSNGRMGAAIGQFGDALAQAPGAQAVVYVCGYAVGFDGRTFLLPSSARLERDTDVLTQGLIARLPVATVTGAALRGGLVLMDLVARPGSGPLPAPAGGAADTKGVVTVVSRVTPAGTTLLASAFAAELGAGDGEVGPLLDRLRGAMEGAAGLDVAVQAPAEPGWLAGGPAPSSSARLNPSAIAAAGPTLTTESAPAAPSSPPPLATAPAPAPAAAPAGAASKDAARLEPAVLNEADLRRVQLALARLGYYAGPVDGRFGPESLAAVRRFQHELATDMTGRLTVEQVARLFQETR